MQIRLLHSFRVFIVFFFVFLIAPPHVFSQFNAYKIIDNGSDKNKLVWVIMGDGYTELQLDYFHIDALEVLFTIFTQTPFSNYISYINVYLIDVVSDESGADHPSRGTYVDTALDASYGRYEINQLLTVDDAKVFNIASSIPTFDMVMTLVNDEKYGGSSGSTVVISNHWLVGRIALHEIGHFMGGLADEYETSYTTYPEGDLEPNVTYETEREKIPWNKWIDHVNPLPTPDIMSWVIGLFEGARYLSTDIYRPRYTCIMRNLFSPYCEICTESIILDIYNYVNPIRDYTPQASVVTFSPDEKLHFSVETERHLSHPLSIKWELDNCPLASENKNTLSIDCSNLGEGMHTVKVYVEDQTSLVRNDPYNLLTSSHTWKLIQKHSDDYLTRSSSIP